MIIVNNLNEFFYISYTFFFLDFPTETSGGFLCMKNSSLLPYILFYPVPWLLVRLLFACFAVSVWFFSCVSHF